MRCRKTDEFTSRNDFGLLPELRKMPAIAGNQVIGTGFVSAFKKDFVIRVTAHHQAALGYDDVAAVVDELQQLQA